MSAAGRRTPLLVLALLAVLAAVSLPAVPASAHTVGVDVDGDGRADSVTVVQRDRAGSTGTYHRGTTTVRVRTARGQMATARVAYDGWYGATFLGTAQLDGVPGRELVVGWTAGAHSRTYRALTWRAGRLVVLSSPYGPAGPQASDWFVDGALSGWAGVTCGRGGTVTLSGGSREGDRGTYTSATTTYRYERRTGHWRQLSSRTVAHVPPDRAAPGGWHCAGLPSALL